MLTRKVLAHSHDDNAGVFRLLIGLVRVIEPDPEADDEQAEATEVVIAEEDFVWADDDPRWENKSIEEIAAEQVEQVKGVFADREAAAADESASLAELPGTVGLEL